MGRDRGSRARFRAGNCKTGFLNMDSILLTSVSGASHFRVLIRFYTNASKSNLHIFELYGLLKPFKVKCILS